MTDISGQLAIITDAGRQEEDPLIDSFRRGDPQAFEQITRRHLDEIHRLASRLLGWREDPQDLVQDVFTVAWMHRKKFRADCSVKSWLYTLTINRCRSVHRRHKLWNLFLQKQTRRPVIPEQQPGSCPDFGLVSKAVQTLPEKYRQVIVLKYLEELTAEEIRTILKISQSTLNTRLSRARQLLKEALKDWTDKT